MKRTALVLVLVFLLFFSPCTLFLSPSFAGTSTITFAWDAPDGAVKYKVYQSPTTSFSTASKVVCETAELTCTVTGVPDGLYYYAATALDSSNNESDYSASVSFNGDTAPPASPTGFRITVTVNVTVD